MYIVLIGACIVLACTKVYAMIMLGFSVRQLLYTVLWSVVAFGAYKRVRSL